MADQGGSEARSFADLLAVEMGTDGELASWGGSWHFTSPSRQLSSGTRQPHAAHIRVKHTHMTS